MDFKITRDNTLPDELIKTTSSILNEISGIACEVNGQYFFFLNKTF